MQTTGRCLAVAFFGCVVFSAGDVGAEKVVPTRLARARFVAFGFDLGDRFVSEQAAFFDHQRVLPKDLEALAAVRALFEEWGHYSLTDRPEQSELLVVVRRGQRAVGSAGIHIPGLGDGQARANPLYGAQLSTAGDMLSVYESGSGGRPETLLWRQTREDGLRGSPPPLFDELKRDVELAAMRRPSGPQVSLEVRSGERHPVVRVGETAVASIGFRGRGWGDEHLRWDLYLHGQRVSVASVPIPGATASGRQIDVEWTLTENDCARIVREGTRDPESGSHLASLTVHVRRKGNEETLESVPATFRVDCSR